MRLTRDKARTLLAAGVALVGLSACEAQLSSIGAALQGDSFPPDRAAWDGAPEAARSAHARALHRMLSGAGAGQPVTWSSAGASGTAAVTRSIEVSLQGGDTVCRGFTDRIEIGGDSHEVRDIACWGGEWLYLREPEAVPVLAPAFAEADRVYTVRRGGSLRAVARRTGTREADLRILNPGLPDRLAAGTEVLLP